MKRPSNDDVGTLPDPAINAAGRRVTRGWWKPEDGAIASRQGIFMSQLRHPSQQVRACCSESGVRDGEETKSSTKGRDAGVVVVVERFVRHTGESVTETVNGHESGG